MIRLTLDRKNCVNCGNCVWFLGKKFYQEGKTEVDEKKFNGQIKRLTDKCFLDLIQVEKIDED